MFARRCWQFHRRGIFHGAKAAAGVGRARIVGNIRNVVCTFGIGHVEFLMDFIVLDVNDPLVIMGLDQMRKYNCLIDIGREKLIFGGEESYS